MDAEKEVVVLLPVVSSRRRIFKTRHFGKWARRAGLTDADLWEAVAEMAHGLVDADLGGRLLKKRVGLPGRGKSGGARTIVATNRADRWYFLIGFAKNERDNIDGREWWALSTLADELLGLTDADLTGPAWRSALEEIDHGGEDEIR